MYYVATRGTVHGSAIWYPCGILLCGIPVVMCGILVVMLCGIPVVSACGNPVGNPVVLTCGIPEVFLWY